MKKVLLAIQGCNLDLYKKNTLMLKEIYRRMIESFDLTDISVDVLSYTAGEKTERIGDTLYTACLDSDEYLKHRIFISYLLEHPEYDYIIKTNATTLVNLSYINAMVKEGLFRDDAFYGLFLASFLTDDMFIPGNLIMSTGNNFRNKLCVLDKYDEIAEQYKNYVEIPSIGDKKCKGVPEDFIWGQMLHNDKDIQLITFSDDYISLSANWFNTLPKEVGEGEKIFTRNVAAHIKLNIPMEERVKIEPFLIASVGQNMIQAPVTNIGIYKINYLH